MSLQVAIERLALEVADFQQGTPNAPKEKTAEWFLLRAKALGLTLLKRMEQLQVEEDVAAAERFYRNCGNIFKALKVPDPIDVVKETLPE